MSAAVCKHAACRKLHDLTCGCAGLKSLSEPIHDPDPFYLPPLCYRLQVVLAGYHSPSQPIPLPLSPMPSEPLQEEQRQQHHQQQQQQKGRGHGHAADSGAAGGLLALDDRTWSQLTWLLSRNWLSCASRNLLTGLADGAGFGALPFVGARRRADSAHRYRWAQAVWEDTPQTLLVCVCVDFRAYWGERGGALFAAMCGWSLDKQVTLFTLSLSLRLHCMDVLFGRAYWKLGGAGDPAGGRALMQHHALAECCSGPLY
eukprot:1160267-Pelagomonas_calceolata.AAC.2